MTLPANQKARRLTLPLLQGVAAGVFPDEIIRKKTHGFVFPVGPWLVQDPHLNGLAQHALARLIERRLVRPELARETPDRPDSISTLVTTGKSFGC